MLALNTWAITIRFMLKWTHARFIALGPKHIAQDQPPVRDSGIIGCLICKRLYLPIVMVCSSLLFQFKILGRRDGLKKYILLQISRSWSIHKQWIKLHNNFACNTFSQREAVIKVCSQNHTGSDRQSFDQPPDILTPCPEVSRATSLLHEEKHYSLLSMCTKTIAPALVSYGRQNLTALCLRIVMFQHTYRSSSCCIPWPFPTEELLITSSDSYWLSYCNTPNMHYLSLPNQIFKVHLQFTMKFLSHLNIHS